MSTTDAAPAGPQPKFDPKMLVLPVMMLLNNKVDFKNPQIVLYTQIGFATGINSFINFDLFY